MLQLPLHMIRGPIPERCLAEAAGSAGCAPTDTLPGMGEPFRHRIRVRWNECDLQGVVFYANYLVYFDVAMTELWREAVVPFGEMNATGADMVVAEARHRLPGVGALRRRARPGRQRGVHWGRPR